MSFRRLVGDGPVKTPVVGVDTLAECLGGTWVKGAGPATSQWINARTDSRAIRPGEIFVALSGSRTDGHDHLEDARAKGAACAIVRRIVSSSSLPQLLVPDPVLALREMARLALEAHRDAGHRLITVTGSVGKTTTRELLRLGLMPEGGAHASRGNENNEIGVPLTLLSWAPDQRYCVLEVGIRKSGDMDYLSSLLSADVGVITAIAPGHLESLGTLERVWEEKSKLLRYVLPGGILVMPDSVRKIFGADPLFRDRTKKVVTGSLNEDGAFPDSIVASVRPAPSTLVLHVEEWGLDLPLSRPSMALAWCALLAILVMKELGVPPKVLPSRLAGYEGFAGRMERRQHPSGLLLLLDHYNANPASMREALDWLSRERTLREGTKAYAVLGDMLELGESTGKFHVEAGKMAARSGIERIWYRGQGREDFTKGYMEGGGDPTRVRPAEDFTNDWIGGHGPATPGILLVKGSRGMKLEEVVAPLLEGM